jgi:hypothetical protein
MIIELHKGMVCITSNTIAYGNIRHMYKDNRDGVGLQIDTSVKDNELEILDLCNNISDLLYKLKDLTESE